MQYFFTYIHVISHFWNHKLYAHPQTCSKTILRFTYRRQMRFYFDSPSLHQNKLLIIFKTNASDKSELSCRIKTMTFVRKLIGEKRREFFRAKRQKLRSRQRTRTRAQTPAPSLCVIFGWRIAPFHRKL